jgi:hypothetical protein
MPDDSQAARMASNPMVYLELTKRANKHKRTGAMVWNA